MQIRQDLALCRSAFPDLMPRPVAVQFRDDADGRVIAMFELKEQGGEIHDADERHYRLVSAQAISVDELQAFADRGS